MPADTAKITVGGILETAEGAKRSTTGKEKIYGKNDP